ncbi:MAG: hypothetical protein HON90_17810 [Halobacteriovoraceae bacterium]|jgi:hypothetical protein|nr:hypothetical protein [Halobacteriovoraceae bacterium]
MKVLLVLFSLFTTPQVFAQTSLSIRPSHFHFGGTSLYCKEGKAFIQVSGNTTGCYQPGPAYISKYEVLEIINNYEEDILGRIFRTGVNGIIAITAIDLGHRYRCDNPRGVPYYKSVQIPLMVGLWEVQTSNKKYRTTIGRNTCEIEEI